MSGFERLNVPPPAGSAVEHRMFNAARRTTTSFVEGALDEKFWGRWVHRDVLVRITQGREGVIRALDEVADIGGACGIVDRDFDDLEGHPPPDRADLAVTDGHDLEGTIIAGPAVAEVVDFHAHNHLAEAEKRWGTSFRDRLYAHAVFMGRLRWLKQRQPAPYDVLRFKKRSKGQLSLFDNYADCVEKDWAPCEACVVTAVTNYSSAPKLKAAAVAVIASANALPSAAREQICNGHDLVGFMVEGFKRPFKVPISVESLAVELALACTLEWLRSTSMWATLDAWEKANRGFVLFKA